MVAPMSQAIAQLAREAAARIAPIVRRTRLAHAPGFSRATGARVYCKLENEQYTGSFKLRGAANFLCGLAPVQRARGCVTASSGNHGAAVAYAMRALGVNGLIFVPEHASPAKIDAIRSYGGELRVFGSDGLDTELHARDYAQRHGLSYVSPYNDPLVIAGQGTCGLEILEALPDVDTVFIAVGGGGLLSGVGSVLKSANAAIRVIGCQPEASAVMARSIAGGQVLDLPSEPTLSDGTAGGIEHDSMTFDLCRELADEFILVSEAEIAEAMRFCLSSEGVRIEGAAGVALAAMLKSNEAVKGTTVAVILCGGNVDQGTIDTIMKCE